MTQSPKSQNAQRRRKSGGLTSLRLLPVTIFVAGLMMLVRVNDIWKGLSAPSASMITLNQSEAQQPPPPGGRKTGQRSPTTPDSATPAGTTGPAAPGTAPGSSPGSSSGSSSGTTTGSAPAETGGVEAVPPSASGGEPPTFTQNEIDVLQKLSERRESLDTRQHDLDLRENMIKAAEARIDKKIAEMKSLQTSVEAMLKQIDEQDDAKLRSLVKIYETMKPKDAARIFEQLDMPVLLGVISRMKEQKVAPVMEVMSPEKAKLVTDALAARRTAKAEGKGG